MRRDRLTITLAEIFLGDSGKLREHSVILRDSHILHACGQLLATLNIEVDFEILRSRLVASGLSKFRF